MIGVITPGRSVMEAATASPFHALDRRSVRQGNIAIDAFRDVPWDGSVGVSYASRWKAITLLAESGGTEAVPVGLAFNWALSAIVTWELHSGTLPPGLSIADNLDNSMTFSGSPSAAGSYAFEIAARYRNRIRKIYALTIRAFEPATLSNIGELNDVLEDFGGGYTMSNPLLVMSNPVNSEVILYPDNWFGYSTSARPAFHSRAYIPAGTGGTPRYLTLVNYYDTSRSKFIISLQFGTGANGGLHIWEGPSGTHLGSYTLVTTNDEAPPSTLTIS